MDVDLLKRTLGESFPLYFGPDANLSDEDIEGELVAVAETVETERFEQGQLREKVEALESEVQTKDTRIQVLEAEMSELRPQAQVGMEYRQSLIDEAVAGRIRVQGESCDPEGYRALLAAGSSLEFLRSEIKAWDIATREVFKPGRQSRQVESDENPPAAPTEQYQVP